MSQNDVLRLLEKHGKLSVEEMSKKTKTGSSSLNENIRKLKEQGLVAVKEIRRHKNIPGNIPVYTLTPLYHKL